jgi:HlyD family secretion protein
MNFNELIIKENMKINNIMKKIKAYKTLKIIAIILMTMTLSCKNKGEQYDASGTFEATEVIVAAEANGKIMSCNILEGRQVTEGEVLGFIDTIQLYLKKLQLETNRQAVKNRTTDIKKQLAVFQQQLATAKTEKARIEKLLKANAVNAKQLDDINAQIAVLEKQIVAQKSSMESGNASLNEESSGLQIQIAQLDDQIRKCYIASPLSGTVLVKYAERGEFAIQGKALFKVADLENIVLRAYVTSGQLTQLKIGQAVKVFADFGENETREYQGYISWISGKSEFTPKTIQTQDERANLVYAVKIALKNDGYLKIGMYGQLKIEK